MAEHPDETVDAGGVPIAPSDPATPAPPVDPLPKPVQEHLGRQLRSAYNAVAERPAFLGDTALPLQFERLIRRIEISERVREVGVEAVRQALTPAAPGSEARKRESGE